LQSVVEVSIAPALVDEKQVEELTSRMPTAKEFAGAAASAAGAQAIPDATEKAAAAIFAEGFVPRPFDALDNSETTVQVSVIEFQIMRKARFIFRFHLIRGGGFNGCASRNEKSRYSRIPYAFGGLIHATGEILGRSI
jgi:hypothetical protein